MNYINSFIKILLIFFFLLNATISYSQEEYESVNTSSWQWSINKDLYYYSASTYKLQVRNDNGVSIEDKKNQTWSSEITWLKIPVVEGKDYTITFNVKNERDPKHYKYKVWGTNKKGNVIEEWHEDDIYWGLEFKCDMFYGGEQKYEINYCNKRKMNNGYTYTSIYESDSKVWKANADIDTRTIKIEFDGKSSVKIYTGYGETHMKSFYNTKGLTWIGVKCGPAAQILVTNFTFKRKTDFGVVLPTILSAAKEIDNKNYLFAISLLTSVINNYKGSIPYYYRARAYIGNENYKSAIEDCDKGLLYPCDLEQKENIYFLRGFSKIMLNDDAGISDMRKAGEIGMRFLRENNLLGNKLSSSSNNTQQSNNKTNIPKTRQTPVLKKNKIKL